MNQVAYSDRNGEIVTRGVFIGTYDACVAYIRDHTAPRGRYFEIIGSNGRLQSYVL